MPQAAVGPLEAVPATATYTQVQLAELDALLPGGQGGRRCVYAAGVLSGLYVVVGNALQPGATVMTVTSAVGMVCGAGTVVIVVASAAKSWRSNRRART